MELIDENINGIPPIPEHELGEEAVLQEIALLKNKFRDKVIILAHHYQHDEIVQFADAVGDSLELAKCIKKYTKAEYIVFCGVHFMAETASMLASEKQTVILPDLEAGCFLADTARDPDVKKAWDFCKPAIPITYINSSASLKAFVGKNNGAICTSSNAEKVIRWALSQGERLFFLPDQHLGRNTCYKMGIPLEQMTVYDPVKPVISKIILWPGYCSVHQGFTANQIDYVRKHDPEAKIIVHPECSFDVVQKADLSGSTSYIIRQIENGTHFAVGTEINLVNRLAKKYPEKKIYSLSPFQCLCTTMYRIRPRWLLNVLRAIKNKKPVNVIKVSEEIKQMALKALDKMLELS